MISYRYKDHIRIFVRSSSGAGEKIIPAQRWKTLLTLLLADPETKGDSFHFSEPQFCHLWNAHNKFRLAFLMGVNCYSQTDQPDVTMHSLSAV